MKSKAREACRCITWPLAPNRYGRPEDRVYFPLPGCDRQAIRHTHVTAVSLTIGGSIVVQHYVEEVAEKHYVRLIFAISRFGRRARPRPWRGS